MGRLLQRALDILMATSFTVCYGRLDSDTMEIVWDDWYEGEYPTREDAEFFASVLHREGELYEIFEV